MTAATIDLLHRAIADPDTQWSLGTFGAIAEFSRDPDEPVTLRQSERRRLGGHARAAASPSDTIRATAPLASESITKSGWNQRIALCLSEADGAMGAPHRADRTRRRHAKRCARATANSILFDLGLGAPHADFCVRIGDRDTAAQLRQHAGRAVFEPGNPAMGLILRRQSASRLHQPARPDRGLSTDPAGLGQESRRAAHPCLAEAVEERPDPSCDRADPRRLGSLRASLSAASGARRIGRGPAVRRGAP